MHWGLVDWSSMAFVTSQWRRDLSSGNHPNCRRSKEWYKTCLLAFHSFASGKAHDWVERRQRVPTRWHSSGLLAGILPEVPWYEIVPSWHSQYPQILLHHVSESPWACAYSIVSRNFASSQFTHAWQNDWTHPVPWSLSSSGTSKSSSNASHFTASITPLTSSPFSCIHWTNSHNAQSTSGLVTARGCLDDNALGIESTCASIFEWCCSFLESVAWLNNNLPSGLVVKYFTTSPWWIGWGRVST